MIKIFAFIWALVLLLPAVSSAQGVRFYAQVDKTQISVDDQILLTVTLEGEVQAVPRPKLPQMNQFIISQAGSSQNLSYVNGQVSNSVSYNYVLMPKMTGKFTLPPIEVELQGKTYQTNPIEITVTPAPKIPPPSQKQLSTLKEIPDLWIETSLDKNSAYVGEQVTLTLKFFQGVRLFQNPEYTPPALTGFWAEDLPPQKKYYQTLGNRRFYVQEIKTALFPTTSGKKTIGAAELVCRVEDMETLFNRDPFSFLDKDLSQLFSQGKPKTLRSKSLNLEVLPLPPRAPVNFSGGTGRFSLATTLDKTEVEAGQPVTLKTTISGSGNIKSVTAPALPEITGFRTYNSGNSENISKADYKLQGTKTFEQILIPKEPGSFTIPPLEFSYFDVKERKYKTLKSKAYTLSVKSGGLEPLAAVIPAAGGEITAKVKDIHYIKTELGKPGKAGYVIYRPLFLVFQILPVLALALLWRVQSQKEKLLRNPALARFKLAHRNARQSLNQARAFLNGARASEFYGSLYKVLSGYLADKMNVDGAALFTADLLGRLQSTPISTEMLQKIKLILEECEQVRFGGVSQDDFRKRELLTEAESLLGSLERLDWMKKTGQMV